MHKAQPPYESADMVESMLPHTGGKCKRMMMASSRLADRALKTPLKRITKSSRRLGGCPQWGGTNLSLPISFLFCESCKLV